MTHKAASTGDIIPRKHTTRVLHQGVILEVDIKVVQITHAHHRTRRLERRITNHNTSVK